MKPCLDAEWGALALAWGSLPAPLPSGHGRADEECVDERARHREDRLLGARLDRDQEKLLRCGVTLPGGLGAPGRRVDDAGWAWPLDHWAVIDQSKDIIEILVGQKNIKSFLSEFLDGPE